MTVTSFGNELILIPHISITGYQHCKNNGIILINRNCIILFLLSKHEDDHGDNESRSK